jgi:hypothetical protein
MIVIFCLSWAAFTRDIHTDQLSNRGFGATYPRFCPEKASMAQIKGALTGKPPVTTAWPFTCWSALTFICVSRAVINFPVLSGLIVASSARIVIQLAILRSMFFSALSGVN